MVSPEMYPYTFATASSIFNSRIQKTSFDGKILLDVFLS